MTWESQAQHNQTPATPRGQRKQSANRKDGTPTLSETSRMKSSRISSALKESSLVPAGHREPRGECPRVDPDRMDQMPPWAIRSCSISRSCCETTGLGDESLQPVHDTSYSLAPSSGRPS